MYADDTVIYVHGSSMTRMVKAMLFAAECV